MTTQHPIDSIQWIDAEKLDANDYNPNHVLAPEFRLLKTSLKMQGWIQPVLVAKGKRGRYTIIDGFHRTTAVRTDKEIAALSDGKVPCAVLDLPESERKMLTVRINRAKGSHQALRMHELVVSLVKDEGLSKEEVARGIGGTVHEVETLLTENIFKKFDVETTDYSKAWVPKKGTDIAAE